MISNKTLYFIQENAMPNVLSVPGRFLEQPHRGLGWKKKPPEAIHIV